MKLPNRQKTQFSLVYLFIALMAVFAVQSWLRTPVTVDIPMSQFLTLVHEGKVLRVSLGEREIQGVLKPGALPTPPAGPGDKLRELLGAQQGPVIFTTARIPATDDYDIVRELQASKVGVSGRIESAFGRDLISWRVPLVLMAALWLFLMRRMGGGPTQALSFGRSKAKIYDRNELKTTFADVAGVEEAKAELMEVVDFLKNPKKYQRLGGRIPKGGLLVGPPGPGKTLPAPPAGGGGARAAGRRQRLPGPRGGGRAGRAVLLPVRLGVRGDVRGGGRLARARSVRAGQGEGALHRVHRRAGRDRQDARRQHRLPVRARRARADPEPAAGRDGRLRLLQGRDHHGRHQPARGARRGAAPRPPLRPAGGWRP